MSHDTSSTPAKRRVLVIGSGGVGTMVSVALERSGQASVTSVLRSNYEQVVKHGFEIESIDHGKLSSWRPSAIVNAVPQADPNAPFDYVIVTMKNIPEITQRSCYSKTDYTSNHQSSQHSPQMWYYQHRVSSVHMKNGHVVHDDHDNFHIGAFHNPSVDAAVERTKLEEFAKIYNASKVVDANVVDDIVFYRWRKVLWNGIFNPMCAITQLDSAAIRRFGGEHSLIRPGMAEMAAIAKADGYDLGPGIVDEMVVSTPLELSFRPSMLVDVDKGNPLEAEVILGNALRVARGEGCEYTDLG
ncbi:Ketopantoate reductase ApbA/PanE [Penicillium expansum]|nr:Ketopantoate reductase ApbA/PanE [Penicillium expansum]